MAGGFRIADAFVEIHADASRLGPEIDHALNQVDTDDVADRLGRRIGSRIAGGLLGGLGGGGGGGGGGLVGATLGAMAARMGAFAVAAAGAAAVGAELTGVLGLLPAAGIAGGLAIGTLKVATSGFGDAIKNMGDPEKFAESLAALSPNAQSAALAIKGLTPQFDALKAAVQDRFFAGLGQQFSSLGTVYLPMLQGAMTTVAGSMNGMIRGIGAEFMEAGRQADMRMILGHSATAVGNLLATIRPIVSAFLDVAAVGAPILAQLTSGAGAAAERMAAFVSKARETGQLHEWIQRGLQAFRDLWTIGSLLFGTITNLVAALGGPSTLLGILELVALALNKVSGFIRDNITWLGPLVGAITGVMLAMRLWQAAILAYHAVSMMVAMANPWVLVAVAVVAIVLLIIANWDKVKAFLIAVWNTIKATASAVWNAITSAVAAAVEAVRARITAIWNGITSFLSGVWNGARNLASGAWNAISSVISGAVDRARAVLAWFGQVPGMIGNAFRSAASAAGAAIGSLIGFVASIPGRVAGALGNLGGLLVGAGRSLIQGFWNGISSMIGWVRDQVSNAMGAIRNLFPFSPAKEGPFSGSGYTINSGKALMGDFAKGILSQGSAVAGAVGSVLNGAQMGFNPTVSASAAPATPGAGMNMVQVGNLTLNVAGNLDPSNPTAFRQTIETLREEIRAVERSYA